MWWSRAITESDCEEEEAEATPSSEPLERKSTPTLTLSACSSPAPTNEVWATPDLSSTQSDLTSNVGDAERQTLADLFLHLLLRTRITPRPMPIPCYADGENIARHSMEGGRDKPRYLMIWESEGENPEFRPALKPMELQVWHRKTLFRFHGCEAHKRLRFVAPSVFSPHVGEREGAVGTYTLDDSLCFRLTGQSLARSFSGATGRQGDHRRLADGILSSPFYLPPRIAGEIKQSRFYTTVSRIFVYYTLLSKRFRQPQYLQLRNLLVDNMIKEGKCSTSLVRLWSDTLNCILYGKPHNGLEQWLLSLPDDERASLWRARRLFSKDDNDPAQNAMDAIQRMVVRHQFTDAQEYIAEQIFQIYERKAQRYVSLHFDELKKRHDFASLHRSSATTFFSRGEGGGAAELALSVGLYRLSRGISSPLSNVYGELPDNFDIMELVGALKSQDTRRAEVLAACHWFVKELERRNISFPFLCIYPERESKGRTFMMLPYAYQLGGYQAATVVSGYLRNCTDTEEVFHGFKDETLLKRIRSDIQSGAEMMLSLDSAVATDPIPHHLCRRIYRPFYDVFSEFTKDVIEVLFSPRLVHVAKGRPKPFLKYLAFSHTLMEGILVNIRQVSLELESYAPVRGSFSVYPQRVPTFLRTHALRQEVGEALAQHGRILLTAPTGSGKTVLAASLFNAIIQFPSTAAIEIFSASLVALNIPHNVHYSMRKSEVTYAANGEPHTFLCTSFFVEPLSHKYPTMVVVLDEAETRQENYLFNLWWTKHTGKRTVLMTATPEEILQEDSTHVVSLPGGTNFPISEQECSLEEMLKRLAQKDYPQSLVCTYSEPNAHRIGKQLCTAGRKVLVLDQLRRHSDYAEELRTADVIISTNVIRASVTLPNLVEVFDLGRVYESVDFPIAGFEALVLMEAGPAMRKQLLGRVGRMQPGTYWKIVGGVRDGETYTPKLLGRTPKLAHHIGDIPIKAYARVINDGSALVEKFHQCVCKLAGVRYTAYRPLWVNIFERFADTRQQEFGIVMGFEFSGAVNRLQSLKDDGEVRSEYEEFRQSDGPASYFESLKGLIDKLRKSQWFSNELHQIFRWTENFGNDNISSPLLSPGNCRALGLSLWRQVGEYDELSRLVTGRYRDFTVKLPKEMLLEDRSIVIVLGLSVTNRSLVARGALPLIAEVVQWLDELLWERNVTVPWDGAVADIPILGFAQVHNPVGHQDRRVCLHWDKYSTNHRFIPCDLPEIWHAMGTAIAKERCSENFLTTQGSPMSSTASFPVLNALGMAVHDWVREQTGEPLMSAAIFGDDDFVVASERACQLDQEGREACGLRTKLEATGRIRLRDEAGMLLRREEVGTALGIFTERLIDPVNINIVPCFKPAGVCRLYQAYHNNNMIVNDIAYLPDMSHYERQVSRVDPDLHALIVENACDIRMLHARRSTEPRRILHNAFRQRLGPYDRVALGEDVNRLFETLEAVILLFHPSTRGTPQRVEAPPSQLYGHPIIGYKEAAELGAVLQGEDCYFRLRGPPLKFQYGPFAVEAAQKECLLRGGNPMVFDSPIDLFRSVGWGNPTLAPNHAEDRNDLPLDWDPIDAIDLLD